MNEPIAKILCGWCDFATAHASEMAAHLINTGHGLDPELHASMQNDPEEYGRMSAFLSQTLTQSGEQLLAQSKPIAPDEIPGAIRDRVEAHGGSLRQVVTEFPPRTPAEQAAHELSIMPSAERFAEITVKALVMSAVRAIPVISTPEAQRALLMRYRQGLQIALDRMLEVNARTSAVGFTRALCVAFDRAFPSHEPLTAVFDDALRDVSEE